MRSETVLIHSGLSYNYLALIKEKLPEFFKGHVQFGQTTQFEISFSAENSLLIHFAALLFTLQNYFTGYLK